MTHNIPLDAVLEPVVEKIHEAGYAIVKVGSIPDWFEKVESIPAPVYRMKRFEQ